MAKLGVKCAKILVTVHALSDLWLNGSFRNLFGVCHVFGENISLLDGSEGLASRAIIATV